MDVSTLVAASDDLVATQDYSGSFWGGLIGYVIWAIALWLVFAKTDYPGWAAIVPIYNIYVLVKIAGYHGATVLLYFIPIVNFIFAIFVAFRLGAAFGKGGAFSFFLLWLFSLIGYLIIGLGSAKYVGPGGRAAVA
ncbi:hypothetical protein SAMN05428970_2676 [Agromyces sp. CF514]|uniref:DUF5684 domain-containing protein n=1 Tax=Agromyces sp. CF514 TaxID=1881031 RepID=UPI0008E4573D|nr:DUF5684 domain-containing protein [Agromyces sp. CF514]SFR82811.1 hypothetical protein SAMN05428970_2676 [Agromyces sp. CF514]